MTDYSVLSDEQIVKKLVMFLNSNGLILTIITTVFVIGNKISIAFDTNEDEWLAWGDFEFDQCGWDMINEPAIYYSHANPLRAAMIVFLMMQENNHD